MLSTNELFIKAKQAIDSQLWDDSLALLDEIISLDNKTAKAYFYRAGIHKKNQRLENAKADYVSIMTKPDVTDVERWMALAFIHELNESISRGKENYSDTTSTKEYQQAVHYYSKCIEVAPNDEEARVDRSIIYCKLGQYAEAIEDTTVIIATHVNNRVLSRAYASRAFAYLLLGNLSKAEADTQISLQYSVKQPRANYLLGCIREQKQQFDDAYDAFKTYLELKHFDIEMTTDAKNRMLKLQDRKNNEIVEISRDISYEFENDIRYDLFLSHYQKTGGLLAMVLKLFLTQKDPNLRIFLDVDDLENIHDLKANVQKTSCFAILLTEGVFERRFVQEEIRTALSLNKKIILIWDKERCAFPDSSTIPSDLASVLLVRAILWQAEKSFRKVVIDDIYSKITTVSPLSKDIVSNHKVILAEPDTDKVLIKCPNGESMGWLVAELRKSLCIADDVPVSLKYWDPDFSEYVPLNGPSLHDLPQKAKIKVIQRNK